MEPIVKWGLVGLAAWYVLDKMGVFATATPMVSSGVPQTNVTNLPSTSTVNQAAPPSQATPATTTPPATSYSNQIVGSDGMVALNSNDRVSPAIAQTLIQQLAGGQTLLSFDQWNYYLQHIRPSPIINWESTAAVKNPRSQTYTLSQYWSLLTGGSGLSGIYKENQYLEGIRVGSVGAWEKLSPTIRWS